MIVTVVVLLSDTNNVHRTTYQAYTRTTLVISLVTDMERPLPRMLLTLRSAMSALCSASSSNCCDLRYLFIVMVTTSSWKHDFKLFSRSWGMTSGITDTILVVGNGWLLLQLSVDIHELYLHQQDYTDLIFNWLNCL